MQPFHRGLLGTTVLASLAHAQTLLGSFAGIPGHQFGAAMVNAGDQNGDGYADVLVGAPYDGDGIVHCFSGAFLATGVGPASLWSATASASSSGRFGSSIAEVGDVTGDGVADFVVGRPGWRFHFGPFLLCGGIVLINGATHAPAGQFHDEGDTDFGAVVVALGDQDGDGLSEIAVNAPDQGGGESWVYVISGAELTGGPAAISQTPHWRVSASFANSFGAALAGGFDLDWDGVGDLAIGAPGMSSGSGELYVVRADGSFSPLAAYSGIANESMGSAISAAHDYNGDGVVDFVVGAPNRSAGAGTQDGRAVVLSGAKLRTYAPPYELAEFTNPTGVAPASHHFGAAVCASPDLNGDGIGEILIGSPEYGTTLPFGPSKGAVIVYSGATLTRIGGVVGANNDRLGDVLLGALQDYDGDQLAEFLVAGSTSSFGGAGSGILRWYRLFPNYPVPYCTAKVNSLGCAPAIGANGIASASSLAPFDVSCANVLNNVNGLFIYAPRPSAAPFQGGTKCVASPLKRLSVLNSGGNSSGNDCSGVFTYDFRARIQSNLDPQLVLGAEVFVQCWSRDPQSPSATSLSNGLQFLINP